MDNSDGYLTISGNLKLSDEKINSSNIDNLNKTELLTLRKTIDKKLDNINKIEEENKKRNELIKKKTKISELEVGDKIYGIGFSNIDNKIYFKDYCIVKQIDQQPRNEYYNVCFGNKTCSFGISSCIHESNFDKHYVLFIRDDVTYFFTLNPETLLKDFVESINYEIDNEYKSYLNKSKKLDVIFDGFINDIEKNK